ncbi:hypothetical protein IMG5_188530 [Ichthyophthirius multifiliis]|uniref:Uncharacterized protein n=1 Tax=Ichthyophthirius multifiliis TaxID=5932 RepID=G0R3Z5_ICHMU|nr:hypothetical protein IMG5_188530 [Ichthyophthirius multifiliis]EGR27826.1 hypothetical protein IMG5_188530 [Ichthyophthirius multifiliis]|eukprot:XP_004027171.1 hypothetical protein IMG5_188530 [Ichthyophthirius multifiliis]
MKKRMEDIVSYKRSEQARISSQQNKKDFEEKNKEELQKTIQIEEHNRKMEEYETRKKIEKQLLKQKMELRNEIIKVKGNQIVKIGGIKIENMTEEDFVSIDINTLYDLKKNVQNKIKEEQENKYKKAFTKLDYDIFFAIKLEERKKQYTEEMQQFKHYIEKEFKQKIMTEALKAFQDKEAQLQKEKEAERNQPFQQQQEQLLSECSWRIVQQKNDVIQTEEISQVQSSKFQQITQVQESDAGWRQNLPKQDEKPVKQEQPAISRGIHGLVANQKTNDDNLWRTKEVQPTQQLTQTKQTVDIGPPKRFINNAIGNQDQMSRKLPQNQQNLQKPTTVVNDNTGGGIFSRNKNFESKQSQGPQISRNTNQKK